MMKNKSKLVLVLILVGVIFSVGAGSLSIYSSYKQITHNRLIDEYPETDGKSIVWTSGFIFTEVYHYDIATNTTTQLTDNDYMDYAPRVDGNYVVWRGKSEWDDDIFIWDVTTKTTTAITNNYFEDESLSINGDYVVWQGREGSTYGDYEIYLYQISTKTTTQVTNNTWADQYPQTSGDFIVWQSYVDRNFETFMYQISTGITTRITQNSVMDRYQNTDGEYVVWYSLGAGLSYYNISTGAITEITNDGAYYLPMLIDNGHIVWKSDVDGNSEIYLHDVSSGTTTQLTNDTNEGTPTIDGDLIVWNSTLNNDPILNLYEISSGTTSIVDYETGNYAWPRIKNNVIVWYNTEGDLEDQEIHMATIGPNPFAGVYEETSENFEFSGNWTTVNAQEASQGAFVSTIEAGASAAFNFTSRLVTLLFAQGSDYGEAEIIIDNGTPISLDQYSSNIGYQTRWNSPVLDKGDHNIKIQQPGGGREINIDALILANPPSAVTLEVAKGYSSGTVLLTWNDPSEDENSNPATEFIVRYATTLIDSEAAWDAAIDIDGEPLPFEPDTEQSMSVTGLIPRQIYFFALRSLDETGNLSDLSNSPSSTDISREYIVDTPFQISENNIEDSRWSLHNADGDYMVWAGPGPNSSSSDVYLYEISTGLITRLTNSEAYDQNPKISGDYVVWHGDEDGAFGGECDIYLYQISTGTTTKITDNSTEDRYPEISGDYVVWRGYSSGEHRVYFHKISTGVTTLFPGYTYDEDYPNIDGNYIVWQGKINGQGGLFLYDIQTDLITMIGNTAYQQPQIAGDLVTWTQYDGTDLDIFMHQIGTDTILSTNNTTDDQLPQTNGDYVVWQGEENGNEVIYLYQFSTGDFERLSDNTVPNIAPNITNDYVVWQNNESDEAEIMLYQLSTKSFFANHK